VAKKKTTSKAKASPKVNYSSFFSATLTPADLVTKYRGNPAIRDLLDSCKSWVAICAHMKAEQAASYPIRLYRKVANKSGKGNKVVGKRLMDLKRVENVGAKSAQYAETAGANIEEVTEDPILNVLHKPNPFSISGHELFYWNYLLQEACGNSFNEVIETGDSEYPFQLLPMFPQDVSLQANDDPSIPSLVSKYIYGRGQEKVEYNYDEVIHFKRAPSMFSPLWGSAPLQGVMPEANLLEMATLNELATWTNGHSINLGYESKDELTDVQVKQLRAELESRHQGIDKAARIFIGNGKLYPIDAYSKEMQYREGQIYYSQLILSAYRVPESKVRLNDANLGSARTADIEYLSEGIRPMLVRMAEALTEELLYKRMGLERGSVWFAFDDIVPRDIATVNAAAVGLVQNRIWTPDEARAELGYGPLPDGSGSKLVTPIGGMGTPAAPVIDGQKVPQAPQGPNLAVDAQTAEAIAAPPADLALNGAQIDSLLSIAQLVAGGQLPSGAAKEILFAAFPTISRATIEAIIGGLEGFKPQAETPAASPTKAPTTPQDQSQAVAAPTPPPSGKALSVASWRTVKTPEGKSLKSKRAASGGLMVLGGRSIEALDINGKSITDDAINALIKSIQDWYASAPVSGGDIESRAKELQAILKPQLEKIFQAGGIEGLNTLAAVAGGADLAASVSFDVVPEKALAFLDSYTIRLAKQITDTQHEDLKSALSTAMEQGSNTQEATSQVQAALGDVAKWKAEEIARTESTRAYTYGNLSAWQEAGVTKKQWLLAPDACPQCKGIAAQFNEPIELGSSFLKVGDSFKDDMGQEYHNTYSNVDAPPLHPACRCDLSPVL
jgi:HK97 family phage portal protein